MCVLQTRIMFKSGLKAKSVGARRSPRRFLLSVISHGWVFLMVVIGTGRHMEVIQKSVLSEPMSKRISDWINDGSS